MKKKIFIYILCGILLFLIVCSVLFDFNKSKYTTSKTKKITLADTTLTPKTYMS